MSAREFVDVVDEHDRVIARVTRGEMRRRNLRHRAVYVLVFNPAGQLFVHQRTRTKDIYPGYWDVAVGGVVEAGEDYDAAARRELQEELGITDGAVRRLFAMQYQAANNEVVGVVYSCTLAGVVRLQRSEIMAAEWMDLDAVIERAHREAFCPDGLEALRLYLGRLEAARVRR